MGPLTSATVRILRLCLSCAGRYGEGAMCAACLKQADMDALRKREILFPSELGEGA